jgi:hypothetical protein
MCKYIAQTYCAVKRQVLYVDHQHGRDDMAKKITTASAKAEARKAFIEHFGDEPVPGMRAIDMRSCIEMDKRKQQPSK